MLIVLIFLPHDPHQPALHFTPVPTVGPWAAWGRGYVSFFRQYTPGYDFVFRNTLNWLVRSRTSPKTEKQKLTVHLLCVSAEAYCVVSALRSLNGHLYFVTQETVFFFSAPPTPVIGSLFG